MTEAGTAAAARCQPPYLSLPAERARRRQARAAGDILRPQRDRVATRTSEALSRKPATRVRTARTRGDARCEAPERRPHARANLANEDAQIARLVVTDADAHVDSRSQECDLQDAKRRPCVGHRSSRLNNRRRVRCRRPRAIVRSSRDLHAQTEAEVSDPNAVGATGGTGDIEARDRVDVAALPLEGKRGRVARPRALRRSELLPDPRLAADRRSGRARERRCGRADNFGLL